MSDDKQYESRDEVREQLDMLGNIGVLKKLNEVFAGNNEIVSANRGFRLIMTEDYLVIAHGRAGDFSTGIPYFEISDVEVKRCRDFDAIMITEKSGVRHGFTIRRTEE